MATTVVIPTSLDLSDYTESVELDGETYELRFRWNHRAECWFCDIADADGTVLVYGRRCVVGSRLIEQHKHLAGMMPGELTAFDTTRRSVDPALTDFGDRVILMYFDAESFA